MTVPLLVLFGILRRGRHLPLVLVTTLEDKNDGDDCQDYNAD